MSKVVSYTKFVELTPQPPAEKVYDLDEAISKYETHKQKADFWLDIVTRARAAGARTRSELTAAELVEIQPTETM